MMRRRTGIAVLAGVLLAGLVAVPGTPAGAQDIADLPRLGFALDESEGFVGDDLTGQVNTDDVAEHCLSLERWVAISAGTDPDYTLQGALAYFNAVADGHIPPPEGVDPALGLTMAFTLFTLGGGIMQDPAVAEEFVASTSVVTFVDPVTQEMLGEMGNFDPGTGDAFIVVPDLDPALYAVVAACVEPMSVEDQSDIGGPNALMSFAQWIEDNDIEIPPLSFTPGSPWAEFVADGAPHWVPEIIQPRAIGIDFYCILQDDGFCATPPGPVGLIDDEVLEEFNGDGPLAPGPDAADLEDHDGVGDLVAVDAAPSFTG